MTDTKMMDESTRDISGDVAALRSDLAKLTASVANIVKSEAASRTDDLYGAVDTARQKLSVTAADAKDRLSGVSSELEASIERNPLTAVLIAMGAGLVIGLLSRGGK